jgi:26S proteasome regulatory subunit N6
MGRLEEAQKIQKTDPTKAEAAFKDMISKPPAMTDDALREYELALVALGQIYRDQRSVWWKWMTGLRRVD